MFDFFKYYKFYEAEGTNNSGSTTETIEKTEDNTTVNEIVEISEDISFDDLANNARILKETAEAEDKEVFQPAAPKKEEEEKPKPGDEKAEDTEAGKAAEPVTNKDGLVDVSEDYIANDAAKNFPEFEAEKLQEILNGIKGEKVSPKIFKNYVHSQYKLRYGEPSEKKEEVQKPVLPDKETFDYQLTPEQQEEANNARLDFVFEELKGKYPGLTREILADKDQLNEFYSNLQINKGLDALDFRDDLKAAQTKVNGYIKDYAYNYKNQNAIMRTDMLGQVDVFKKFLTENNIKPEDIKADLTESFIVKNILKNPDGSLNLKVVGNFNGHPKIFQLKQGALVDALKDKYFPEMLKLAQSKGLTMRKETEPAPSLSGTGPKGRKVESTPIKGNTRVTENMSIEEAKKVIEANKQAALQEEEETLFIMPGKDNGKEK